MRHTFSIILIGFGLIFFAGCSADEKDDVSATIEVQGVVTSDLGQPLDRVLVKSSQDSSFTDKKGKYTVRAYPRGALEFIKPGFKNHIEPVEEQQVINVTMKRLLDGSATRYEPRQVPLRCGDDTSAVATVVEITDFGQGAGTMTWTKNKVWVLKNRIFVNAGQTLTIEPGTIVKGAAGSPDSTGSLIVARGGLLIANGTPELPIIFTAESDSIARDTNGQLCRSASLSRSDSGLWGGLILCGSASVGSDSTGLRLDGFPDIENRVGYGGSKPDANSGILRFISVRHAGRLSSAVTLAGVGSGATIDHVEVYACRSRGFRFMGGRANTRHLVAVHCGSDAFHFEKNWQGQNQFWLAVGNGGAAVSGEAVAAADSLGEMTGPVIANATFSGGEMQQGAAIRGATSSEFHHCIFVKYAAGFAVKLPKSGGLDSVKIPVFKTCLFGGEAGETFFIADGETPLPKDDPASLAFFQQLNEQFQKNENLTDDPGLGADLVPGDATPPVESLKAGDPFFDLTNYRGCFAPGKPAWTAGWTRSGADF
jgi:hypothetical protein